MTSGPSKYVPMTYPEPIHLQTTWNDPTVPNISEEGYRGWWRSTQNGTASNNTDMYNFAIQSDNDQIQHDVFTDDHAGQDTVAGHASRARGDLSKTRSAIALRSAVTIHVVISPRRAAVLSGLSWISPHWPLHPMNSPSSCPNAPQWIYWDLCSSMATTFCAL